MTPISTPSSPRLPPTLQALPPRQRLAVLVAERKRRQARNRLASYRPYTKQREFHAAGAEHRERLLMAGNQLGKTLCAAAETSMHLTGRYPDWWEGRRWDRPVHGWAGGVTSETTRDVVQRHMLGAPEVAADLGTGWLPAATIVDVVRSRHMAGAVDSVIVRHASGGVSTLGFKSYEKGREKWQGATLDFVWLDEEPPLPIYMEALTRTNATGGVLYLTFTPLLGMSEVVRMFLAPEPATPLQVVRNGV